MNKRVLVAGSVLAVAVLAVVGAIRSTDPSRHDAASLRAQRANRPFGPMGGPRGGSTFEDLGLTQEQQRRIDEVMRGRMRPTGGQRPDPAQFEAMRQQIDQELRSILTPEQFEKLQASRPSGPPGGLGMGPNGMPPLAGGATR